jgi:hypothetical protein
MLEKKPNYKAKALSMESIELLIRISVKTTAAYTNVVSNCSPVIPAGIAGIQLPWRVAGGCLPALAFHGSGFSPVHGENDGRVSR